MVKESPLRVDTRDPVPRGSHRLNEDHLLAQKARAWTKSPPARGPGVIAVFADLGGHLAKPLPAIAARAWLAIDADHFDYRLKHISPRLAFEVPNRLTGEGNLAVDLTFEGMDDFSPARVIGKVDALRNLSQLREQVARTGLVSADVIGTVEAFLNALEKKIAAQLNLILSHPDFLKLQRAWRAVHALVQHVASRGAIKIRVMDIAKTELHAALQTHREKAWELSPLLQPLREGNPLPDAVQHACLLADYDFDHDTADRAFFALMAQIGMVAPARHYRGSAHDHERLLFAGVLASQARDMEALRNLLHDYFRISVDMRQLPAAWQPLPGVQQLSLSGAHARLGRGLRLGRQARGERTRLLVVIGPLTLPQYFAFLPGGSNLMALKGLLRCSLGPTVSWDLDLLLHPEALPRTLLGVQGRLGWTNWLLGPHSNPHNASLRLQQSSIQSS